MRPEDSILKVRRSIHIAAKPEAVWRAFTTFEEMEKWWGARRGNPVAGHPMGQWLVAYEPRVGGRIEMAVEMDGAPAHYGGAIVEFAENCELTFENDWMPNQGWARPTFLTVRLAPALDGTLVELFHHGFERTGADGASDHAGYEQGWGMLQLTSLKTLSQR